MTLAEETMKKTKRDPERTAKILFNFVQTTMWASVVILIVLMVKAPSAEYPGMPEYVHVKAYYTLMLTESILGCVVMWAARKIQGFIKIPSYMLIPFVIFLYCAIFLGEVRNFYYKVPNWDTFLHFFSACMLGTLAFSIVSILNQSNKVPINLSPAFIAIFAFSFALSIGALWEIYEFTFDGLLGLNMQKFMLEDGTQLVGHEALRDTMKDLMVDTCGAAIVAIGGYVGMKKNSIRWLNQLQLHFRKKEDSNTVNTNEEVKA